VTAFFDLLRVLLIPHFQGSRVTPDSGLILGRELDERLGFGELTDQHLTDSRRGKNTHFPFADLSRSRLTQSRRRTADCPMACRRLGVRIAVSNEPVGCILLWLKDAKMEILANLHPSRLCMRAVRGR